MQTFRLRSLMPTLLAGVLFLSIHSHAQEGPPDGAPPGPPPEGMQQQETPSEAASHELKQLSKKLKLSDQQKVSIRPILVSRYERMAALFSDRAGSMDGKRNQMNEIMESSHQGIRDLLHDDQKVEFDKLTAKMPQRPDQPD